MMSDKIQELDRLVNYMSSKMSDDIANTVVAGMYHFIHISHDDLDGYGCNVVKYLANINISTHVPLTERASDPSYNTSKLNDEFYTALREYLYTEINFAVDCGHIGILITDIGGLKFDKIQPVLQDVLTDNKFSSKLQSCKEVNVYIVDHHRSEYMNSEQITESDHLYQFNGMKVLLLSDKDTDGANYGCIVGSSSVNDIRINYFYAFDTAECATSLLAKIFNINNSTLSRYVKYVRSYDLGKCDQWEIENTDDILHMVAKVNPGIILNAEIQLACKNGADMNDLTKRIAVRTMMYGLLYPDNMEDIYNEILKMNNDYATFVSMVTLIELSELPNYLKPLDIPVVIPYDQLMVGVIIDTADFNEYNFTSYSKRFFKENSCCDGLIRVDLFNENPNISTRSPSRVRMLDCYTFCKTNGGGGHIHAAGFPIHMEK